jgi:hypothetical protein
MNESLYLRTHRGFLVLRANTEAEGHHQYYSNPAFGGLVGQLNTVHPITDQWTFVREVAIHARNFFADNPNFFRTNLLIGNKIPERSADLLLATIEYLATGRRRLALENHRDLMEIHAYSNTTLGPQAAEALERKYKLIFTAQPSTLVGIWLSQPGGLIDLVEFLNLVAGPLPSYWKEA